MPKQANAHERASEIQQGSLVYHARGRRLPDDHWTGALHVLRVKVDARGDLEAFVWDTNTSCYRLIALAHLAYYGESVQLEQRHIELLERDAQREAQKAHDAMYHAADRDAFLDFGGLDAWYDAGRRGLV